MPVLMQLQKKIITRASARMTNVYEYNTVIARLHAT